MALQPGKYNSQERMQPGADGSRFVVDQPGYRDGAERINRTNNKLNVSAHDVPNIKYEFDYRLPSLFRYGYAFGFNQMVITKGRIVAVDQNMDLVDFESKKQFNTLTIANGGVPVQLRKTGDLYKAGGTASGLVSTEAKGQQVENVGKEWIPVIGMEDAYTDVCFRPFKAAGPLKQLADAGFTISAETGKVMKAGKAADTVRAGNVAIGMLQRNEYTRDQDAYNGMMPGPVLTDSMVELPWFAYKDKAEGNPWGSAYGALFPGALVKSDENGRVAVSPLSFEKEVEDMTISEYELERQQLIGQIYAVNNNLVPEGAAKWATWALEDRLGFEGFNPDVYKQNNRKGEDAVSNSPFNSKGEYPGYPYDKNYMNHDLHMLASTGRKDNYDARMNPEFQYSDLGIPGLTDGANAVVRPVDPQKAGLIHYAGGKEYVEMFFRTLDVNIEADTLQFSVGGEAFANCTTGATAQGGAFVVKYANELQGVVVIEVADKTKADAFLQPLTAGAEVKFQYSKRGMAGIPTFLDWDGCCGSVKVLLTK
jgi:hypothetical protein